jgi:hypothetical protein
MPASGRGQQPYLGRRPNLQTHPTGDVTSPARFCVRCRWIPSDRLRFWTMWIGAGTVFGVSDLPASSFLRVVEQRGARPAFGICGHSMLCGRAHTGGGTDTDPGAVHHSPWRLCACRERDPVSERDRAPTRTPRAKQPAPLRCCRASPFHRPLIPDRAAGTGHRKTGSKESHD